MRAAAYEVPTDGPESDGTLHWDSTTIVVVELDAAGRTGLGLHVRRPRVARLVSPNVAPVLCGHDVSDTAAALERHVRAPCATPGARVPA